MIEFKSEENIKQAWKKIIHYYYYYDWKKGCLIPKKKIKDINVFQFLEIQEFFANSEQRLSFLIDRIQNDTFEPEVGSKFYIPKYNRGLRPFVVLSAEDLIFYQCVINVLVELFRKEFELFADNTVYSNIPAKFNNPYRITNYWLDQLKKFNKAVDKKLEKGKIVVHSDITSFYTEISHPLLRTVILKKCKEHNHTIENQVDVFLESLSIWTNPEKLRSFKGIPQGLPQSHILANIFLFPLDRELIGNIEYIRWVDDFRIFGGTRNQTEDSIIELDQALRRYDLLIKESKTFLVDKKLTDPFKSLENDIKDLLPERIDKDKLVLSDGFVSVIVEESYVSFSNNDYENIEIPEEMESIMKELPEEEETNLISSSQLFYLLRKINDQKLFNVCKSHIFESLVQIYTNEEIKKIFINETESEEFKGLASSFANLNSEKTIDTSDILVDRYQRKLRFLYRTILTLINHCDNNIFYVVLRICMNKPYEIGNYSSFFQMSLTSEAVSINLKMILQDWLIELLAPNQPVEFLKYFALEILDSDTEGYRRKDIEDLVMNYLKKKEVSWFLKDRCYRSYLNWPEEKTEAIQFCLSHYDDIGNTTALKLSVAQMIVKYRLALDRTKYAQSAREHEIQELFEKMIPEENSSLSLFAVKLMQDFDFIVLSSQTKQSKIAMQLKNELNFKCSVRKDLEKLFNIRFTPKFSLREKVKVDNQLQPSYKLIQQLISFSKKSYQEEKYETYINSITGLIEALLFSLYSYYGLRDDNRIIEGFSFHKKILSKLFIEQKYSWNSLIDEIAIIRNRCLLSHIRNIKTSEFNPGIDEKIIDQFNNICKESIQNIIDCFENIPSKENIEEVNEYLKGKKVDYKKYYNESQEIIVGLKTEINNGLTNIDQQLKKLLEL